MTLESLDGADLVVLLRKLNSTHAGIRPTNDDELVPENGFSNVSVFNLEDTNFAHALAHNFGCHHHPDDVQFDPRRSILFGVARYEIAGRRVNPKLDQPYYGAGEITQMLRLTFN